MADSLVSFLPEDFVKTLTIPEGALPLPPDSTKMDDDFGKYIYVVPGEFVARQGSTKKHLRVSLGFLRQSTKRFTVERSIRPFLRTSPGRDHEFCS